ncbi:tandem-95 repeat protein [Spongiibacter nanhainus]|uniref:Tandem-95 repeat protein n=1 Tax=Spongiibacter nanhainus TaxID=2794344 RepID=A0A7T4R1T0_9GAMM|nr:tandem-95 repeat protein [Spongiibacter nanhainus]QQD18850.1 tandem-95 repeat protein [Spongiibacter nanhainus]
MNQDNLTTVITSQGHAQDIAMLDQLSIPVDQLVAALDEVVTRPLSWREEKEENDKEAKDPEQQAKQLAAADVIAVDIPMAASEGSLQNIDTSYQSGYSGYDGGSEGLPPVAVFGLGLLAVVGIAAALSGGGGSSSKGGGNPPVNSDPILDNIQSPIATNEDQSVTFNVSSNDPDGDTIQTNFTANNGTVNAVAGNPGQFEYTPNADFNGTDQITVEVTDGRGGFDSQTVVVNVAPVNDAPEAATLNSQTANGQTVIIDATTGASDPEGDPLTYQLNSQPSNGSVNIIAGSPGQYEYIPDQGFTGTDSFTVTISDDNGASINRTIQVQVGGNIAPEADAEQDVTLAEDTPTTIDIGATDANGDTLSYEITASPDNGSVESTGVPGEFEYTPNANFFGSDSFTVTVTDGNGGTVTQTVNLTITAVNDAPEADAFQNVSSPEGASVNIQVDATDVEGDTLSYAVVTDAANGTVVNNGNGSFTYTPTDGDFIGQDSFEVEISDGNGGTTTQEVRITVNADNDAPQVDDTQTVSTESAAPVTITVNATDAEGDPLSYGAGSASNGSVVPGSTPGQFIYRPDAGFAGEDSFEVIVSDGNGGTSTQTVTVTVADSEGTEYDLTPLAGPAIGLTDEADIIRGSVSDTGSTLNAGDSIDGQGGFDSLQISQSVDFTGFGGANPLSQGSLSNVEGLEISNTAGTSTTFNATGASGLEYLFLDANDESFIFDALSDTDLTFELEDADSVNPSNISSAVPTLSYQLNFGTDVNDNEDDSLTLILNDVGRRNVSQGRPDDGVAVIATDIENLTIVAQGQQNYIDLLPLADTKSITIGGEGELDTLTFNNAFNNGTGGDQTPFTSLSSVNASAALGDLTLALYSQTMMNSLRAGFGNDIIAAGNNIRSSTFLDGGDGEDILMLSGIDDVAGTPNATLTPDMRGFETLDLGLESSVATFTLSLSNTEGLQTVQVSNSNGIDGDAGAVTSTTIRDRGGEVLNLDFRELAGQTYNGNDNFTVQDSGELTISTISGNNNSSGSFADNVTAVAAPHVNLVIGADTTYSGIVTANAADSASIQIDAGGAIDSATLSVTSAETIAINGATDTEILGLSLLAENVTDLNVSGSAVINGLGDSNLNSIESIASTSLGGMDLTFTPATGAQAGIGAFSQTVNVDAESAVVATAAGLGLNVDIAAFLTGNGAADITGSSVLDNQISAGTGRNQITVVTGSGDDRVTLNEQFEANDGANINLDLGNGVVDTLVLTAASNNIESLTLSGVEFIESDPANGSLALAASAVSGQTITFTNFASTVFLGTSGEDTIDLSDITGAPTTRISGLGGDDVIIGTDGNDTIIGGGGADNMTGGLGDNTYVFTTGSVVAGETITFNNAGTETLRVNSSTEFFALNNGARLSAVDAITIVEGQTASFLVNQLSGNAAPVVSGNTGGAVETLEIHGTDSADTIDLEALQFTISNTAPVMVAVDAGVGADTVAGRNGIDNTYIYNTGDVGTGETIAFGDLDDTFVVESSTGFGAMNGGNSALTGLDTVELAEGTTATFNAAQLDGLTVAINGSGNNGGESLVVNGGNTPDTIDISTLNVDTNDVTVTVNAGQDDDTIIGSGADDILNGEGGLDSISGGLGADTMSGGANSDTFVHSMGDGVGPTATADNGANGLTNGDELGFGNGVDTILDFGNGDDLIDLDIGGAQLTKVLASQAFDVDLTDFGLQDNEYVVIRGDFGGTLGADDVFTVNDSTGSDLLLAFDANANNDGAGNPAIDTVDVEFILLSGAGGTVIDGTDFVV